MTGRLIVTTPGPFTTVQDLGRRGFRRYGVPSSGVLHPDLARIANALAGNADDAPLLEFFLTGPGFRVESGRVRIACAGDFPIRLMRNERETLLPIWRSVTLAEGDRLQLGPVATGRAGYVAINGGLALEEIMRSRSTYLRGGFGGLDGSRLRKEMQLPLCLTGPITGPERFLPDPPGRESYGGPDPGRELNEPITIRVILGPQDDWFDVDALATFLSGVYTVTNETDRMGTRLAGPMLAHRPDRLPEIVSDAMVPGVIQVPGSGAPIVMLADGPTVGGYPKIATVASVDLPRFALLVPGRRVSFRAVTIEEGADLLRDHRRRLAALIARIAPLEEGGNP